MASIICPKCGKHNSVFDLKCFSCGYAITEEERERQLKVAEKQMSNDSFEGSSPQKRAIKHQKKLRILKKLNRISFGLFKIGWAEIVVPSVIVILIIIVAILMII